MTIPFSLFVGILLLLLLLLILVWFYIRRRKQYGLHHRESCSRHTAIPPTFQELQEVIANPESTLEAVEQALDDIMTYYAGIEQLGDYAQIIHNMCRHGNIGAKTIVRFEKALREHNPSYAREIEKILQKALDARG